MVNKLFACSETEKENASVKNVPANTRINGEEPEDVLANHRPPKAMVKVKPQVLTHVIEGFVIQEAAEPFPMPKSVEMDEPPSEWRLLKNLEYYD